MLNNLHRPQTGNLLVSVPSPPSHQKLESQACSSIPRLSSSFYHPLPAHFRLLPTNIWEGPSPNTQSGTSKGSCCYKRVNVLRTVGRVRHGKGAKIRRVRLTGWLRGHGPAESNRPHHIQELITCKIPNLPLHPPSLCSVRSTHQSASQGCLRLPTCPLVQGQGLTLSSS